MSWNGSGRRTALTLVLTTFVSAAIVLFPVTASAHVTVSPGTAEPGGYTRVAFRVPNERADASTTRLEVSFPTEHRFRSVSVLPVPGWTATTRTEKSDAPAESGEHNKSGEVVTGIVWEGGTVLPGQFQEFPVSMGPLPKMAGKLVFKALQTYSSGEVVRWIDVQQDVGPRPEHPAPTLSVAAPLVAAAPAAPAAGTDTLGRVLGGAGLLLGLFGIGLSLVARRRPSAPVNSVPAQGKPAGNRPVEV